MKMIQVNLSQIEPVSQQVDEALLDSLRKRGLAFPIKVTITKMGYRCVDGKKRLAALQQLALESKQPLTVQVVVVQEGRSMDSGYWGPRNQH